MSIKSVLLTSADMELLARMPITSGSRPRFNTREESRAFQRMIGWDLIIGAEGCFSVRWGLLSKRQYARVEQLRSEMTDYERLFGREVAK